jgi:hypothetical protein
MSSSLPCRKTDLIWVVWEDACGDSTRAQRDVVAAQQLAVNVNLGWIIHEDAKRIVLAHGTSSTGEIDHFVIPQVSILERIYPFRAKPRKTRRETKPQGDASPNLESPNERAAVSG